MRTLFATLLLSPVIALAFTPAEEAWLKEQAAEREARWAQDAADAKKNCVGGKVVALPALGMTEKAMLKCTILGQAGMLELVNTTEIPGVVARQYRGKTTDVKFVYTRNGVVTGVQK